MQRRENPDLKQARAIVRQSFKGWSEGEVPDPRDEILEGFMARTLAGEVIPFDEWEDALEELEELDEALYVEPTEEEMREAEEARADFLARLDRFDLSLSNRFQLCEDVYAIAAKTPSDELLRLYSILVCDDGYLLDLNREFYSSETAALCWRKQKAESNALYSILSGKRQMSERFQKTVKQAKKRARGKGETAVGSETEADAALVFDAYMEIMKPRGENGHLSENIAALLQTADRNPALVSIKPLFLYRVLTRHANRLRKDAPPQLDLNALWHYQNYQLEEDNGKNFKTYARYNELFEALVSMFRDRPGVDTALSLYGYDHLSNLGEFYRAYRVLDPPLDFGPTVEDIFLKTQFTCFENGYGDNVMLEDNRLSERQMKKLLCSEEHRHICVLDRVYKYLNRNIVDLTARFLEIMPEHPEQVRALCQEALQGANIPLAQRPKNQKEGMLLLAVINQELMDSADNWAEDYLLRAGKLLIGDDPLQ